MEQRSVRVGKVLHDVMRGVVVVVVEERDGAEQGAALFSRPGAGEDLVELAMETLERGHAGTRTLAELGEPGCANDFPEQLGGRVLHLRDASQNRVGQRPSQRRHHI